MFLIINMKYFICILINSMRNWDYCLCKNETRKQITVSLLENTSVQGFEWQRLAGMGITLCNYLFRVDYCSL